MDYKERVFVKKIGDFKKDNTPEFCAAKCAELNYDVVGVQFGQECWCDHVVPQDRSPSENHCNKPCNGDSSITCGGAWRFNVYEQKSGQYIVI